MLKKAKKTQEVASTPDEEHIDTQAILVLVNHVRSRVSNGPVPQPVRRSTQSDSLGSGSQWEKLTNSHAVGPQVAAKKAKIQEKATKTLLEAAESVAHR